MKLDGNLERSKPTLENSQGPAPRSPVLTPKSGFGATAGQVIHRTHGSACRVEPRPAASEQLRCRRWLEAANVLVLPVG